jgi:hypothetical protein
MKPVEFKHQLSAVNIIKMKTLSIILGVLAILNMIAIFCAVFTTFISRDYLIIGIIYAVAHLIYQRIMNEGLFTKWL